MTENDFRELLYRKLQKEIKEIKDFSVTMKESLIYKIIVNQDGKFQPYESSKPTRGNFAFETDLLVKKGDLPLVVIETKIKGFHTHDVLTYSAKAVKHKEIYPYLRYGLVVGEDEIIANKFFTHNVGFDFALVINDTNNLNPFISLIRKQIKNAVILLRILKGKNTTRMYSTNLEVTFV